MSVVPLRRDGFKYVGRACCGQVKLTYATVDGKGFVVMTCLDHGASVIHDGKIIPLEPKNTVELPADCEAK